MSIDNAVFKLDTKWVMSADPKLHEAFDESAKTLCGRQKTEVRLADLSPTGKDEITCGICARVFDYHFGD